MRNLSQKHIGVFILSLSLIMTTPEPQKKYNQSEKGRKARREYNKRNRQELEAKRGDRSGTCSICGRIRWLIRKEPPTCRTCDRKLKAQ